jgi:hypothetical protein
MSTSVVQRGKTGVAQYVFALLRALQAHAAKHAFTIFVLEEDLLQARKFDWHRRRGLTMNVYVGNAEKG